jgi:putative ABC transport system permease protein
MTISALTLNFSVLAILITMFGLFGLASFDAERRTKEIGVRKVHGATVWQITRLLLVHVFKIFFIAALIVVPLDYYILDNWLASFQYRTSLDVVVFGVSVGMLLLVTLLTVSYETIRAAIANPVDSLRYE